MTLSCTLLLLLVAVCVTRSAADPINRTTNDNVTPKHENVSSNDIVSGKVLTDKPKDMHLLGNQGDVEEDEEGDEEDYGIFMVPRKAKSILRVRRGWNVEGSVGEDEELEIGIVIEEWSKLP